MSTTTMPDKRDMATSLKAAFPPAGGAVQRRSSRSVREAVRRLDLETVALVAAISEPFHETLQEIADRMG